MLIRDYYAVKAPGSEKYVEEFEAILNSLDDETGEMKEYIDWVKKNTLKQDVQDYYIRLALQKKELLVKEEEQEAFQKFFYIYRLCKEQRNLSNHANTGENQYPLSMKQLKRMIEVLLDIATGMEEYTP